MLDGNSEINVHVSTNVSYLICSRHSNRQRAVTNWIFFHCQKNCFSFMRTHHVLNYQLEPWLSVGILSVQPQIVCRPALLILIEFSLCDTLMNRLSTAYSWVCETVIFLWKLDSELEVITLVISGVLCSIMPSSNESSETKILVIY